MTRFGPWSVTLALGAAFGLAVALLLCFTPVNRTANRLLAALIGVIVLKLGPYILGFAGYYDAYPWLSFAPLGLGLAIGPLVYLYAVRLTGDALPRGWGWHLLPGGLQFAYRLVLFLQPLAVKNRWNDQVHRVWIDPAETFLELGSMALYLVAAARVWRGYQHWLDAQLSNREEFRLVWLRNFIAAFAVLLPVWIAFEVTSYATGFNYYQRFPLYVVLTGLVFYLGLEGWRNAGQRYPVAKDTQATATRPSTEAIAAGRDWAAQGRYWQAQLAEAGWWRDPELSLDRLARQLGTNTAYLSRALNEGLALSFNETVNQLRVAEICRRLDREGAGDLLQLAYASGFNSKTSFNRVFKLHTGQTPSQYRARRAPPGAES